MKKNLITTLAVLTVINAAYEMDASASIKISDSKYERMLGILRESKEEDTCLRKMAEIINKINWGDTSDINEELIPGSEITPLYFANLFGMPHWENKLRAAGAKIKVPNRELRTAEKISVIKAQLERGDLSEINDQNILSNKMMPMHAAVAYNLTELIKLLVSKGVNVSLKDGSGYTPLHYAALMDFIDIGELLINNDADIDERDSYGCTSLHLAAACNRSKMVKLLIEKKANINERDNYGRTPFYLAVLNDSYQAAEFLIKSGANIDIPDQEGFSPFGVAIDSFKLKMCVLLIGQGANSAYNKIIEKLLRNCPNYITSLKKELARVEKSNDSDKEKKKQELSEKITGNESIQRLLKFVESSCEVEYVDLKILVDALIANKINVDSIKDKNGNTPLLFALQKKWGDIAETLILGGANVNVTNKEGNTPLFIALVNNLDASASLLISHGADTTVKNQFGQSLLHQAAFQNLSRVGKLLIGRGAAVNALDSHGDTPLHYAAHGDAAEIGELLLDEGAAINVVNKKGQTPLRVAIESNYPLMVDLLMRRGATVGLQDLVAAIQKKAEEVEKLLISGGIEYPKDIQAAQSNSGFSKSLTKTQLRNFYKRTISYQQLIHPSSSASENSNSASDDDMASINNPEETSNPSEIHLSDLENVDSLYANSTDALNNLGNAEEKRIEKYQAKLLKTLRRNHPYFAQLVHQDGKNAMYRGTPLISRAVYNDILSLAKLMISLGADKTIRNEKGETLLHIAAQNNSVPMLQLLLDSGLDKDVSGNNIYKCTALYQAIYYENFEAVKFLVEHGANVNFPDSRGTTPLIKAAQMGLTAIAQLLLEHSAIIDLTDHNGETALYRAAFYGQKDMVDFLLQHKANPNIADKRYGGTPIFAALLNDFKEIALFLIKAGAEVNIKNFSGLTPLHVAYKFEASKSIQTLLSHGADPKAQDNWGRMPHIPESRWNKETRSENLGLDFFPSLSMSGSK